MLPGLSGLEVCRELRAGDRTRHIPILMLTAKAEETDQVVGFSHGRRRLRDQAVQRQGAAAAHQGAAPPRRRSRAGGDVIELRASAHRRAATEVTVDGETWS